jgi:hypothetical protein
MERIRQARGRTSMVYHGVIEPLRVVKQIVTIFFSVASPRFREAQPELEKFIRDKEARGIPPDCQIRVFWFGGGVLRQAGPSGVINTKTGQITVIMEFVHPPFGYSMVLAGKADDQRPTDINDFANFQLGEAITLNRRFPVLQTNWMMPGDYRTQQQIARDAAINDLAAAGYQEPEEELERRERLELS